MPSPDEGAVAGAQSREGEHRAMDVVSRDVAEDPTGRHHLGGHDPDVGVSGAGVGLTASMTAPCTPAAALRT